jgi:hypothetical protein
MITPGRRAPVTNVPVPDPSLLTTDVLRREILHLRELVEARLMEYEHRFAELERQLDRRITSEQHNLRAAQEANEKAVTVAAQVDEKRFSLVEANAARIGGLSDKLESTAARVDSVATLMEARFDTYRALITSQAEKVALALAASDKAVTKAETATEKRFESVNEFRAQLSDQTKGFVARLEFDAQRAGLGEKVDGLVDQVNKAIPRQEAETRWTLMNNRIDDLRLVGAGKAGGAAALGWVFGAVGMVAAIVAIISKLAG